ncbi:Myb domain-contaning protein, partial [Globisporangium splendens]
MVITNKVSSQYFDDNEQRLIRIAQEKQDPSVQTKRSGTPWTTDEHNRFLRALELYPLGPWKVVATFVGTRTTRQTMTHGQKYREKIARHKRSAEQFEALRRLHSSRVETQDHQLSEMSDSAAFNIEDDLYPFTELDDLYDATLTSLLEAYEPLDLDTTDDDLLAEDLTFALS